MNEDYNKWAQARRININYDDLGAALWLKNNGNQICWQPGQPDRNIFWEEGKVGKLDNSPLALKLMQLALEVLVENK